MAQTDVIAQMGPKETASVGEMAWDWMQDAWQRGILFADVRRQRGDQYRAHMEETAPHVLGFSAKLVMDGGRLPRPVNYALVRVAPHKDVPTDPAKRPFVIVDPRAGHGPGIGGFKPDSEIGAALEAGHPCYFVGFLPDPQPGQTVEDVMRAEAAFLEHVIALHPDCDKPVVIGNCQAGWQVLMTAALRPELFGPIIVAGAPLSYWAGLPGQNPMRYAGGLLGGSWMTALAGDLGGGRFDGATLVQNFENLDPANTLWEKSYDLYANIDTEAPRYLGFEKYWGGHVFLNDVEMQYIVDKLFVGNQLSSAELMTSGGLRIDLRNIRSPIVVFCSKADNITPPPQALGWITDLYDDDEQVLSHNQTIIYAMHESIGHLGIFVSGAVGRKEHRKFATNIELINLMPAGIYEAVISDGEGRNGNDEFVMAIEKRSMADVREIVRPDPDSDRRFAAVARISDINLSLYRNFAQPWVRAMVTPQSIDFMRRMHPLRISYEHWSSRNGLAPLVKNTAQDIRTNRHPVAPNNPFLTLQTMFSGMMSHTLDTWRVLRDKAYERSFEAIYDSPLARAMAGLDAQPDRALRPHPGISSDHQALVSARITRLLDAIGEGGLLEAGIRALFWINLDSPQLDERQFNLAITLEPGLTDLPTEVFRAIIRRQAAIMLLDADAAIAAIPDLLAAAKPEAIRAAAQVIQSIETTGTQPSPQERDRLHEMLGLFAAAAG